MAIILEASYLSADVRQHEIHFQHNCSIRKWFYKNTHLKYAVGNSFSNKNEIQLSELPIHLSSTILLQREVPMPGHIAGAHPATHLCPATSHHVPPRHVTPRHATYATICVASSMRLKTFLKMENKKQTTRRFVFTFS